MRAFTIASSLAGRSVALPSPALADEKPVDLKKAPGLDKVEGNCGACHSLDYIQMNSPFLNAALWDAEVNKMIKAFGAPISDADAKAIKDYLEEELRELTLAGVGIRKRSREGADPTARAGRDAVRRRVVAIYAGSRRACK